MGRLMPSFRFTIPLVLLLAAQARSELHVPAPVMDLGEVKSGLPLTNSFELINTGSGVVEILETRASCGCLIGKVEPRNIQPGKSATPPTRREKHWRHRAGTNGRSNTIAKPPPWPRVFSAPGTATRPRS